MERKPAVSPAFPDFERASLLGATMMLAYVLGDFIVLPERSLSVGILGILIEITLTSRILLGIMTAALAISGTTWLLHTHPYFRKQQRTDVSHWALPGLTAWALSVTLSGISPGLLWWVVLIVGTGFLVIVWIAEFIAVNPSDPNFRFAASGLTALAFALYLVLAINLRAIGTRLIFLIPSLSIPVGIITGRYLILKLQSQDMLDAGNRQTSILTAGTLGAAAAQLATAFHFLPVSPLGYGLALLSPIYAANLFFGNQVDGRPALRTLAEPLLALVALWIAAVLAG